MSSAESRAEYAADTPLWLLPLLEVMLDMFSFDFFKN